MFKRLIFDVDDTLIEWKNEYWDTMKKVFEKLNMEYKEETLNDIIKAIDTYEEENFYYDKQQMLKHINKVTNCNFDTQFLNTIFEEFRNCVPERDEKVITTLEYLKEKYELVALTNWFKYEQERRMEKFGILHFFSDVFAGEKFKIKPFKESFVKAIGNRLPEECIMIGDSFKNDIKAAIDAGLNAIYINPNLTKGKKDDYIIINSIEELKSIL